MIPVTKAQARIQGALVGLAVVAIAGVFFFVVAPLFPKAVAASAARSMSPAEIKAELGEYDQKIDCAAMGAPPGWQGYAWIKIDGLTGQPEAAWFLCEP